MLMLLGLEKQKSGAIAIRPLLFMCYIFSMFMPPTTITLKVLTNEKKGGLTVGIIR
jgi:hypothetical protein